MSTYLCHIQKIHVLKMRMLRLCDHTKSNKTRNEDILNKVEPLRGGQDEKMRLGWFRHVKTRCVDAPVRRCGRLVIEGMRRAKGVRKNIRKR